MIISCRHFTEIVDDAREGTASAWQRARVALHRGACPFCRAYERGLDALHDALHDAPPEAAPASTKSVLLERFRARSRGG
jgi:hypothetical protein